MGLIKRVVLRHPRIIVSILILALLKMTAGCWIFNHFELIHAYFAAPTDTEFMAWENLKPNQIGFGLTVFKGEKREKFYVEFDGIINHPLFPQEKLILVRMGYPLLYSDVLGGMSGSPVYFKYNGKWRKAGAIAFSIGNLATGKSLGGITPIQAMISQEKIIMAKLPKNSNSGLLAYEFKKLVQKNNFNQIAKMLSQPLELGNYQGYNIKLLNPQFSQTIKNDKSNKSEAILRNPKPGDAVAMVLASGDFTLAATCTITHEDENNFWGCGHPFLGEGNVVFPAYKGKIASSFKSPLEAFKLLESYNAPFGFVKYDHLFAIKGVKQALPDNAMIKAKLTVTNVDNLKKIEENFEVFKHNAYSQAIISQATDSFLNNLWPKKAKATAVSKTMIEFCDGKPLVLYGSSIMNGQSSDNFFNFFGSGWPTDNAFNKLNQLMQSNWNFNIKSINIDVRVEPGEKYLLLDSSALLDKNNKPTEEADLGDELKLVLGLRSSDPKKHFVIAIPIKIPADLKIKTASSSNHYVLADIFVESGKNFTERDVKKKLNHEPDTAKEFIENLLINEKDHQKIYAQILLPPTEIKTAQEKWPVLEPQKWTDIENINFLRKTRPTEKRVIMQEISTPQSDFLIDVSLEINLKINIPDKNKRRK